MHSPSPESLASSEEDIEMLYLEEIAVTPNPRLQNGHKHEEDEDEDDLSDGGDEGERALLSPAIHTRWHDNVSGVGVWSQIRGIVVETLPTLLLTTVGLLLTGELLDHISRWRAMKRINELIMIIPVILNLKGNIEMNLSARLSTSANMGELDTPSTRNAIILGNLALLQVQATVVSFVAACVSFLLDLVIPKLSTTSSPEARASHFQLLVDRRPRPSLPINDGNPKSGLTEFVLVASTAMSAASLSAIILVRPGSRVDADNIAPPIASCLGDLVTLTLLGIVSTILILVINTPLPLIVIVFTILTAIACAAVTRRNLHVKDLLAQGWSPLIGAMVITSGSGLVLDMFVSRYDGYALLAVAIGGLPGGAGSILVSRLSTALHAAASSSVNIFPPPSTSVTSLVPKHSQKEPSTGLVIVTLFLVTIPVELVYLLILRALGWLHAPFVLSIFALIFLCIAVSISLVVARYLTNFLWARGYDPDMYALPMHSALMDLSGQLLLVTCFELASALGVHVRSKASATLSG
ncbi:hypothetical protein BV25DRAFT_1838557 [Artomyces pyxidatus]|uniref:Uncharacterized protein n=1 Tax=Artomyces pyxidatus TaxID=48021 RepID=A0ACB8T1X1_9AGAM|nr:hypothetical protein BV25DRAFT_1838557 [Artomyces pyxidatus]